MYLSVPSRESLRRNPPRTARDADTQAPAIASSYSAKELPTKTYFNVPYERNENFVGREDCLETINKIFSTGPKFTPFVSLYGLGGIGYEALYSDVVWSWF